MAETRKSGNGESDKRGAAAAEGAPTAADTAEGADAPHSLTVRQEMAVRQLGRGKGVVEAARRVGVSRTTLYRWMSEPEFVACVNRWRAGVTQVAREQVFAALGDAAATVAKAAAQGDAHTALTLLKELGVLRPVDRQPEDAAIIARQRRLAQRADRAALDEIDVELLDVEAVNRMRKYVHAPPRPRPKAPVPDPAAGGTDAPKSAPPKPEVSRPAAPFPPETVASSAPQPIQPPTPKAPIPDPAPIASNDPAANTATGKGASGAKDVSDDRSSSDLSKEEPPISRHRPRNAPEPIDWMEDDFIDVAREDR